MQRPRRARRAVVFHDDRLANEEEIFKKKRLETAKKRRTNPHIPVPVEPLPDSIQEAQSDPLPAFTPPFRIEYESFAYPFTLSSPLSIFMLFFSWACVDCIVENTNSYASNWRPRPLQKYARKWLDLTRHELLRYIGLLFYMGRHSEPSRELYWKISSHNLGRYMSRDRFSQISRFLSIRCEFLRPFIKGQDHWWWKLEPLASIIRQSCQNAVYPSAYIAVDEIIVKFTGRSTHKVKLKGKPILEGFKL